MSLYTQARVPDGILYTSAHMRYRGWSLPVTHMSLKDCDSIPQPGYEHLKLNRSIPRPLGNLNWQRGLTFEWVIPRGHWVASYGSGIANWLSSRQTDQELQPKVLAPNQRCTHEFPQVDTHVDGGRFDLCRSVSVNLVEHLDPREPLEVHYWGLGYLSSLTEVDESDSVVTDTETASSGEDEDTVVVKLIFTCTDIRYR